MDKSEDFSEFMWMEEMDEFDREVEQRLQEEEAAFEEWNDMVHEDEAVSVLFEPEDWTLWVPEGDDDDIGSALSGLNPFADPFVPTSFEQVAV